MAECGDRILGLLQKMGISQRKFAEKLGIHPSAMNMIITGKRAPSKEQLVKIAAELGTTIDYLYLGIEPTGGLPLKARLDDAAIYNVSLLNGLDPSDNFCIYSEWESATIKKDDLLILSAGKVENGKPVIASVGPKLMLGTLCITGDDYLLCFDNGKLPIKIDKANIKYTIVRSIRFY